MKSAAELDYQIHHLCIYDEQPRDNMWPYLRWHHGITNFFSGDVFHIADEGHADYTFLGCGGRAFQIQLEAPPYQFKYEQEWYKKHGNGYNHICWIVNSAKDSYEQLQAAGASIIQEFEVFPTYEGFVMADPEGRWIEIMEYTDPTFRVQEFTNQPSGECGLKMIGFVEIVKDMEAMTDWYQNALDMKLLRSVGTAGDRVNYLSDKYFDASDRNPVMILSHAQTEEQEHKLEKDGPYISGIVYQANDVKRAFEDATWAGMEEIAAPEQDPVTGVLTARLREPSGNEIVLREAFAG